MKVYLILLLLFPLQVYCQLTDNFSDGDFTNNPTWTGETTEFKISTSKQLQLNATIAYTPPSDTAYLSTPNGLVDNTEWDFWAKMSFATSANNNGRVYLVSDQPNLKGPLNGYFVQLGDYGDGKDSLSLFLQSGTTFTKIIAGTIVYTNNTVNAFRIKVVRDNAGNWSLFSDPLGGTNFQPEGAGFDDTFTNTAWFGVLCKFTSSNSIKFYFDDFYVGPIVVDTIPPKVNSVHVISSNQLDVHFSENTDAATAGDAGNYFVNNGIGNPGSATPDSADASLVHLVFTTSFAPATLYTIYIGNVQDLSNNTMLPDSLMFSFYTPKEHDVVINEIMADPDPPLGLPNYEYVELYNRTIYPISLKGWMFRMGTTIKTLPDTSINPLGFLLLTTTTGVLSLMNYGTTIGVTSFGVTNTGETLTLYDSLERVISTVTFTDDWYQDPNKKNGGWSIEQIDPNNPCGGESNWRASTGVLGGTPGAINSVNAPNPDHATPQLVRACVVNYSVQLYFSEPMDSLFLQNPLNFTIDNGIGNPATASPVAPDYLSVILGLTPTLQTGIVYNVTVLDTLKDCAGNALPVNSSARFAIPDIPLPNAIVINEILSNPKGNGVNYVELYNRTDKVFDLKDLVISSYDTITSTLTDVKTLSPGGFLVFPQDYVVLTTNAAMVKSQYYTANINGFAEQPALSAMNNDNGIVVIALKNLTTVIDKLVYSADMFYPLLNSNQGVSLERISFDRPTDDKTNWHSAAETAGFGTPAYKNSQFSEGTISDDPVTISPEIFSPDNDGHNDVLNIGYHFSEPGYMGTVVIYDAKGRLIRNLVKNVLFATSGSFSWDGITDENEKARIGIYIIYFEVFDLKGNTKHYKKTAVLASKL